MAFAFGPLLAIVALLADLPSLTADLDSDSAALLAIRAAVGRSSAPLSRWNASTSPCEWKGISCAAGRVTELHLPGASLIGEIPASALSNLTELSFISLRSNGLSGPIPSSISSLPRLQTLNLKGNRLSGEIPASLSNLRSLVRLDLSNNILTGAIPSGISNLNRLATLFLEFNRLSGEIPDLDLPNLDLFNVSYNPLAGSIPSKLSTRPPNAFLNTSLCGAPLAACGAGAAAGTGKKSKLSGGAVAGIAIGAAAAFLIVLLLLVLACRRKGGPGAAAAPPPPQQAAPPVAARRLAFFETGMSGAFDLEELLTASADVLGKGTFGTTYKVAMENGMVVAVKRMQGVSMEESEFMERIGAVAALRHPNLLPLYACFYSRDEKLLVYHYMEAGSLFSVVHAGSSRFPLNWDSRIRIALAASRAIEAIHSSSAEASHGNIKSSNILLSNSLDEIRVSDHGLVQLVSPNSKPNRATGYHAPEVVDARRVSQKADVYSFGVLLLELLTGKSPALMVPGMDISRWVQSVVEEEWTNDVFDMELLRYSGAEDGMVQLLKLAISCVAPRPGERPRMHEVVAGIKEIHHASTAKTKQRRVDDENECYPLTDSSGNI